MTIDIAVMPPSQEQVDWFVAIAKDRAKAGKPRTFARLERHPVTAAPGAVTLAFDLALVADETAATIIYDARPPLPKHLS